MKTNTLVVIIILNIALSLAAHGQSSVARPLWSKHPNLGGTMPSEDYLPSEYTGSFVHILKTQFPKRSWITKAELASLRFSPASGILQFQDKRVSIATITGWDTGFDRVYSCNLVTDTDTDCSFLCSVRQNSSSKCQVIRLTLTVTGQFTQVNVSSFSNQNEIWVAPSIVDSHLYICDMQSMVLKRYLDSNTDGVYESLDTSFVVNLPTELLPDSKTTPAALDFLPLAKFKRSGTEVVSLEQVPRRSITNGTLYVTQNQAGNFQLLRHVPSLTPIIGSVSSPMVPGQTRLEVYGTPGVLFAIKAKSASGTVTVLANGREIQDDGHCIVTLSRALVAGESIKAKAKISSHISTKWEVVGPTTQAILFEFVPSVIRSGLGVTICGDLIPESAVAFCKDSKGDVHSVGIGWINSGQVAFEFPQFGTGDPNTPPFLFTEPVSFWLEDPSTLSKISNYLFLDIRHN